MAIRLLKIIDKLLSKGCVFVLKLRVDFAVTFEEAVVALLQVLRQSVGQSLQIEPLVLSFLTSFFPLGLLFILLLVLGLTLLFVSFLLSLLILASNLLSFAGLHRGRAEIILLISLMAFFLLFHLNVDFNCLSTGLNFHRLGVSLGGRHVV